MLISTCKSSCLCIFAGSARLLASGRNLRPQGLASQANKPASFPISLWAPCPTDAQNSSTLRYMMQVVWGSQTLPAC